jgi:multidrug efflux pump subunit AcrB
MADYRSGGWTASSVYVILGCSVLGGAAAAYLTYHLMTRTPEEQASPPGAQEVRELSPAPVILVTAAFPGAAAVEVAKAVAGPIERQLNGVEGLRYYTSRCVDDGGYTLAVTFERGFATDKALASVRERVERARPDLIDPVRKHGISVREKLPGMPLLIVVSSPDGRLGVRELSDYARLVLRDRLPRLPGVEEVALLGGSDASVRVRPDPAKLAAHGLTMADLGRAIREQHGQIAANFEGEFQVVGTGDRPFSETVELGRVILKTDDQGRLVYVRDVATVRSGSFGRGHASYNGKPAVVLTIYPTEKARPHELRAVVGEELARFEKSHPGGARLESRFGFTPEGTEPPECLLLDVILPDAASQEHSRMVLRRCEELVRPFVDVVLALTDPPFQGASSLPNQGYLLMRLAKGEDSREKLKQSVRKKLTAEVPEALILFRDVSGKGLIPRAGYPIALAIHGPDPSAVTALADNVVARLRKSDKLTDVFAAHGLTPSLQAVIDHAKLRQLGLQPQDVFDTLQVVSPTRGGIPLKDVDAVGDTKVRTGNGRMVPLRAFVEFRRTDSGAMNRFNGRPMVRVTANHAPGAPFAEARTLCESQFEAARKERGLPAEYQFSWLEE